jgi:hypothetical protein
MTRVTRLEGFVTGLDVSRRVTEMMKVENLLLEVSE